MQILHRFAGSIQRYSEELADPDRSRPDHCPQCEAHRPLITAKGPHTRCSYSSCLCLRNRNYGIHRARLGVPGPESSALTLGASWGHRTRYL